MNTSAMIGLYIRATKRVCMLAVTHSRRPAGSPARRAGVARSTRVMNPPSTRIIAASMLRPRFMNMWTLNTAGA